MFLRMNIQILDVSFRKNICNGHKTGLQLRVEVTCFLFLLYKLVKTNDVDSNYVITGLNSLEKLLEPIENETILKIAHAANCISGNSVSWHKWICFKAFSTLTMFFSFLEYVTSLSPFPRMDGVETTENCNVTQYFKKSGKTTITN